ncbi:MAG TPA: nuclear transport factor 2 family protein [Terriglobales bacterium]|nr:nuclear transport factor 2 family protein [Terriglobales bacterium]
MKRLVRIAVLISVAWAMAILAAGPTFADETKAVVEADQDFVQALGKSDKAVAGKLLDADFTWTNTQGKTVGRSAALTDLTALASANPSDAEVKETTFGEVGEITAVSGKTHVLRVWVKRPAGWRLLVSHAATLAPEGHLGTAARHGTECVNPCKTIPYKPKNEAERGVIASWQALETAVTNHESQNWGPHVADEFMLVSSGNDHPLDKKDRMDILDKQKKAGTSSAPAPLVSARMFDFGDTVVMSCLHQSPGGKPTHVTRIWINRDGRWQLAYSQQTSVQGATGGKGSKS